MTTYSLARRVHIVAVVAAALALVILGIGTLLVGKRLIHHELRQDAGRAMSAFDANLHYSESQVEPLLRKQLGTQFLPQAVPFYAAARTNALETNAEKVTVRLPTTNPTNEADRPSVWEANIIAAFASAPDLGELEGEQLVGGNAFFTLSRPIVAKPACLSCHGAPSDAPSSLVEVYGSGNGFGWRRDEVVGATVVTVPKASVSRQVSAIVATFSTVVGLVFIAMLGVLDYFVQLFIVRPLGSLAQYADDVSLGAIDRMPRSQMTSYEVGVLAKAFDRMRNSLASAIRMLEQSRINASPESMP